MQRARDNKHPDADGMRIVDKRDRRAWHAKLVVAAVAAVSLGAVAARVVPWNAETPDIREAAAPEAAMPRHEVPKAGPARSMRTVRAVPAAAVPAPAPAAASPAAPAEAEQPDLAQQAERALDDANHELASATPERARELARDFAARAEDMLKAARDAGERTGIAAFPPPGTNPIKTGVVVPRNFELPEGYIRYTQITDDGRRLEPVLMFSPDYEFFDANGNPVKVPDNGIVPAEMAPAGLPLRMLAMPKHPYGASLE